MIEDFMPLDEITEFFMSTDNNKTIKSVSGFVNFIKFVGSKKPGDTSYTKASGKLNTRISASIIKSLDSIERRLSIDGLLGNDQDVFQNLIDHQKWLQSVWDKETRSIKYKFLSGNVICLGSYYPWENAHVIYAYSKDPFRAFIDSARRPYELISPASGEILTLHDGDQVKITNYNSGASVIKRFRRVGQEDFFLDNDYFFNQDDLKTWKIGYKNIWIEYYKENENEI